MQPENAYIDWVGKYRDFIEQGKRLPLGKPAAAADVETDTGAPTVLVMSPHPDDECIAGALPLRLMRESHCRAVNLAVTLGSKKARRAARLEELTDACACLGFEMINADPGGLERIHPAGREEAPENWKAAVDRVAGILESVQPEIMFMPHAKDWNQTHIGVHLLGVESLARLGKEFSCRVIETEFWHPLYAPNLMVESSDEMLALQLSALSMHVGELERNPYHLSLPAWLHDNVRRGAECLGGQGEAAPDYLFATLYRQRDWARGGWGTELPPPRMIPVGANPLDRIA